MSPRPGRHRNPNHNRAKPCGINVPGPNLFGTVRAVASKQRRTLYVRLGPKAEKLRVSVLPPKRTSTDATGMSALCQKRTDAPQQTGSFDHLVGEDVELRRDRHAERVG